jgi:rhamnose utilization protein RhaD (predicted bifunctional aldolase and dehydrogenase)
VSGIEQTLPTLLQLSRELGAEHRHLAILGEGNTSAKLNPKTFLVKASGSNLGTLTESDVVECRFTPLLELMKRPDASDAEIDDALNGSRVQSDAKRPSVEALFHAWLLSLPGIAFVGHTHPEAVNAILCSPRAEEFATRRLFPDQIVCCGESSVLTPYCDPGLKLAQSIAMESERFISQRGAPPRVILLKSHGIITLGATVQAVQAAMFMTVKAAHIFLGAAALGGPVYLADADIARIASRSDEHYRQRALKL